MSRKDFYKIRLLKIPPPTPQAVSLLKQHSLLAHYTPIAASSEGSILLCNVERHASAPARFESLDVDDVQVVRRAHRSSRGRIQQCTPKISLALTSLDPRWVAQQLLLQRQSAHGGSPGPPSLSHTSVEASEKGTSRFLWRSFKAGCIHLSRYP